MLYCTRYSIHTICVQLIEPYLDVHFSKEFRVWTFRKDIQNQVLVAIQFLFMICTLFLFLSSLTIITGSLIYVLFEFLYFPCSQILLVCLRTIKAFQQSLVCLYTTCFVFCYFHYYGHLNTVQLRVPAPQGEASPKAYLVQKKLLSDCYGVVHKLP